MMTAILFALALICRVDGEEPSIIVDNRPEEGIWVTTPPD